MAHKYYEDITIVTNNASIDVAAKIASLEARIIILENEKAPKKAPSLIAGDGGEVPETITPTLP
jgi:hypothetical protein